MTMTPSKEELKYNEYLNVIANTCLLFNSRKALGKHIDYNLEANNASSMNYFRKKSTFCELSSEVDEWFNYKLDLKGLLQDYQEVSQIYADHFKRSYSIDLREGRNTKREQLFKIINFLYDEDRDRANFEVKFLNTEKKECLLYLYEKKSTLYHALFLLLMVHILPSYNSKKGSADAIQEETQLLIDFLHEYSTQAPVEVIVQEAPVLTVFEHTIEGYHKNGISETRIDLIHLTSQFLNIIEGYTSADKTFLINQKINKIYPDLDGFWSDSEIPGSHFWQFQKLENGFLLHEYNQTTEQEETLLLQTSLECIFYSENNHHHLYVCHPTLLSRILNGKSTQGAKAWDGCEFHQKPTRIYPINTDGAITRISLSPRIRTDKALIPDNLYRVAEDKVYKEKLSNYPIRNLFEQERYYMRFNSYAITHDALLVMAEEEECRKMGLAVDHCLIRIPKSLDGNLDRLTLSDGWGLCNFIHGELYFAVPDSLLFYPITTEEARDRLGIELCFNVNL